MSLITSGVVVAPLVSDAPHASAATSPSITSPNSASVSEHQRVGIDVEATDDLDAEGSGLQFHLATPLLASGDVIIPVDTDGDSASPAGQGAEQALDDDSATKYLNSGGVNSGFIVTPAGRGSIIDAFRITTANDAADRDPASYELYGTDDIITSGSHGTGTDEVWTLIDSDVLDLPTSRQALGSVVAVDGNTTAFRSYKLLFPSLRGGAAQMQIADVQFFADVADDFLFSIDPDDGVITFVDRTDYENPLDLDGDNDYHLQVTVTDSEDLTAVQDIVITVIDDPCTFPRDVATESEFDAATICYNDEAPAGDHVIDLTDGFARTEDPIAFDNPNGATLTINGGTNTIDGAGHRTLSIGGGSVTVDDVALENGSATTGGAVHVAGGATLALTNSTVSGSSSNSGGGVRNDGTLTISHSTFTGNSTSRSGEGGGLSNYGTALVDSSTFTGNSAAFGAALYTRGTLTVTNSTVSGNAARSLAGAIYIFWSGSASVHHTTIWGSSAQVGGGILNNGGSIAMNNSIIAGTTRGSNCYGTIGNTGSLSDDGSCGSLTQSSQINLGPLQDNGGPTLTHGLLVGSTAIDAGDDAACAHALVNGVDQRGTIRPQGESCDVGAFEVNVAPTITSSDGSSVPENQTSAIDVQATDAPDAEGSGLTFGLTGGADQGLFDIDAATGVVTFATAPDFEDPADSGGDNTYDIEVTVTDSGGLAAVQAIAVTVTDVNEAPSIDAPAEVDVPENGVEVLDAASSDPEGDTEGSGLTYSLSGADSAAFDLDSDSGVITFAAAPDYEDPGDADGDNVYEIEVTVTDSGGLTDVAAAAVTVTDIDDDVAQAPPDPVAIEPTDPTRYFDSRPGEMTFDGLFAGTGLLGAGTVQKIDIAGRGPVPTDAVAVAANLTVVGPVAPGFATLYPCTDDPPLASNLNYGPGDVVANNTTVALDGDGALCVFTLAAAHYVIDINGYVPAGSHVSATEPARYLETRLTEDTFDGSSQRTGRAAAGATIEVQIAGRGKVPADATAAIVNLTLIAPDAAGFATLHPCGTRPATSTLNYAGGEVVPNGAVTALSARGTVCIYTLAGADIALDVLGYVSDTSRLESMTPARVYDDRAGEQTIDGEHAGGGRIAAGGQIEIQIAGRAGVPDDATGVFANVAVVGPAVAGFITLHPCGALPTASNVNYVQNQVRANNAYVQLSAKGTICLYTLAETNALLDITGFTR